MSHFYRQLLFITLVLAVIVAGGIAIYAVNNRGAAPVAWYKMDEGFGTSTQDSSGNGYNIATTTGPIWQNEEFCKIGKCLYFDGVNDYASTTNTAIVNSSSTLYTTLTYSVWINPTSTLAKVIMQKDNEFQLITNNSGNPVCQMYSNNIWQAGATSSRVLNANSWQNISCVYNGAYLYLYIDGINTATTSYTANATSNAYTALNIGRNSASTGFFPGRIDDIRIYNYARAAAQIKADYTKSAGGKGATIKVASLQEQQNASEGLVAYWKMDEASWNGTANEVVDASGNGNHGTAAGGATFANTTATAKFGMAGNFDGTDDYVSFSSPLSVAAAESGGFTFSAWVKPNVLSSYQGIVGEGGAGYSFFTLGGLYLNGSKAVIEVYRNSNYQTLQSTTALITNQFYFIVGTFNASDKKLRIYINGKLENTSVAFSTSGFYSAGSGVIGKNNNNVYTYQFFGQIDDIKIYKTARTAEQIRRDYETGPPPVAHWKMDENNGQYVYDSSGNNNTGTLGSGATADSADPQWQPGKYGSALKFDGSNDYVSAVNSVGNVKTVEFWVNNSNVTDGLLELINNDTYISIASNVITPTNFASPTIYIDGVANQATLSGSGWHHIAITTHATTTGITASSITIGEANNDYTTGYIDDVKIYNYVRTPKQILEDMNANHPAIGTPVGSYVAYWPLDEQASSTAYDKSINKNDLTLNSASWTTNSKFNGAWNGTGATWLSRADDADFDFLPTEDFSISMWVKSDSTTNPTANEFIIRKANASAGYGIYFDTLGYPTFGIDDDTTWSPDATTSATQDYYDNQWHHVVAVKNATTSIQIFVDGVYFSSSTAISAINDLTNSASLVIGDSDSTDNGDEFNGDIDEIKIYRLALSPLEIKEEYNRGVSLKLGTLGGPQSSTATSSESLNASYCIPGDTSACAAPIAHWRMDEASGQYVQDISGNNNIGTLGASSASGSDDPIWKYGDSCKTGACLSFDGSNDYIIFGTATNLLNITGRAITVGAWVKASIFGTYDVIAIKTTAPSWAAGYGMFATANSVRFFINSWSANVAVSSAFTPDGKWHYWVGTYDADLASNQIKIYKDGVLDGTPDTLTANITAGTGILTSGNLSGGTPLNGQIDDIRIYNYARTAAQVAWDYNRGAPVAWWKMDDGWDTATTCDGTGTNVKDNSYACKNGGTCNNGTLTLGAAPTPANAWSEAKFGCGLTFDGTDDYVSISSNLNRGDLMAVSFWAKPNSTTQKLLELNSTNSVEISSGVVAATGFGAETIYVDGKQTTIFPDTNWHHIVVVSNAAMSGNGSNLGKVSTTYYTGILDDVRVYNYAPTATQIKTLYNEGAAVRFGPSSGLP